MKVGTKSVLFGIHAFYIHPWFVAWAWWKLYGFPWDPRLWVAFFVHDIGYIGKPNMDCDEGELHPVVGAVIMDLLFDTWSRPKRLIDAPVNRWLGHWGQFTLLHSRYFAKRLHTSFSRLCVADKLAMVLTPAWLYLPMARWSGEINEYMAQAKHRVEGNEALSESERRSVTSGRELDWYRGVQTYMKRWVEEHRDGRVDTWTSNSRQRATVGDDGVWR